MKIIGLVGGISWHSTQDYYKYINEGVNEKIGGVASSRMILHSVNYADIKKNNDSGDTEATYNILLPACEHMKNGGAEGIVLCANTMHMFAERLEKQINLPVIHIAKATADAIQKKNLKKVVLLGTKFTMEMDFFKDKLRAKNIEVIIPDETDRTFIHKSIFDELGKGIFLPETKAGYQSIVQKAIEQGAEGVILGCTEIPLLIKQSDLTIPAFDTTKIHSDAAVNFSVGN
jgi:aspartate racemase